MQVNGSILNVLRINRRNWKTVVLCIIAATVFWFFNALNKTYTTNINFPLRFDYDAQNFVPVRPLPEEIRINVKGNGWDLFKRSTGIKIPSLEIPLKRPAEVKKIVGSTLPVFFSNQLEGLEINFVLTDTLYVDLEVKTGKWITLTLDSVRGNIRSGYGLASTVAVMPDSVFIEGPKSVVENLHEPVKLSLKQKNIDDHFMEDVEVNLPSADVIKRNPPTVAVMFNVERMITIKDSVRIEVVNTPPTVASVQMNRKIPVTLSVPENMIEQLHFDSITAVLDLKNFLRGKATILPRINGAPPYTEVIKIDSVRITL